MISFLKPAPPIARLPAERIDGEYRRLRWRVFAGIFLGYAGYYLVRKNLSLAYGGSKFIMGSVSDRSNPRWFLPLGLLLSCGVMAACGLLKFVYSSLFLMVALQVLNGWVNGMGWPPCGKTMVHWWSARERSRIVSLWNTAHNVGNGTAAPLALLGVALFHDWSAKFYFNAIVAAAIAVGVWFLLRDTPQSCGLPSIEEYKDDYPDDYSAEHERTLTFREILFGHVLNNKFLWAIAIANAFAYFVRYGVVDWIPTYLQRTKGFSFKDSSIAWAMFEYAAIPGTILCGWISDRFFKRHRAPATMLFMALTLIAVVIYALNAKGPLWIDQASLIAIGFFIYGPIMMIGLHALDLVPKNAAGTAAGLTGFFGYVFGSSFAGWGVGKIADRFGWNGVFATMVACCVLTIIFCALTLAHKPVTTSRSDS